jgi:acyl carrier protein
MTPANLSAENILSEASALIRDVVDSPHAPVDMQTTAQQIEGWDSFNHINIIVAIEAHFHIKFHSAEMEKLQNVGELVRIVQEKLAAQRARN